MRTINWAQHRAHREQIQADQGQWIGLIDEDGIPLLDLPPQMLAMDWPEPRGTIEDISIEMLLRTPTGRVHPVSRELIAGNLGVTDALGKLVPVDGPARHIAIERPGLERRVMRISYPEVDGGTDLPRTMEVQGADLRIYLKLLPAPSHPLTWTGDFTRFTRDWVGPEDILETFEKPRDLADIKLFTVADGASIDGPADQVIFRLIDESLQAVSRMAGITSHPPYVAILEDSEIPPGPVPPPLYRTVSVRHRWFSWDAGSITGDARLIKDRASSRISFTEVMTCDRAVRQRSNNARILAGSMIPAGIDIGPDSTTDAVYTFTTDTPEILPAPSGSPYTILRPTDQTIWDEVGEIALANGIHLGARMWWPGDPQPPGRTLLHPTIIFSVRQEA